MPARSQRSEILSRISQIGIAEWRAVLVKIDILVDLNGEITNALSIRLLRCASRSFDRFLELACLRVSSREGSNEDRITFPGKLIGFCRQLHRNFVVSQRIIRAGRDHPGEIVEGKNGVRIRLQSSLIMIDRLTQQTFLDESVSQTRMRAGVGGMDRQCGAPLRNCAVQISLLKKRGAKIVMRIRKIGP